MSKLKSQSRVVDGIIRNLSSIQLSLDEFRGESANLQTELHSHYSSLLALSKIQPTSQIRNSQFQEGKERMRRQLHQQKDSEVIKKKKFIKQLLKLKYPNPATRAYLTQDLIMDKDVKTALLNNRRQFAFGNKRNTINRHKLLKSPPGSFIYDYKPEKLSQDTNNYVMKNLDRLLHNYNYRTSPKRQSFDGVNQIRTPQPIKSSNILIGHSTPQLIVSSKELLTLPLSHDTSPDTDNILPRLKRKRRTLRDETYNIRRAIQEKNTELVSMKRRIPKLLKFT